MAADARTFRGLPEGLLARVKDYDVRLYAGVHPKDWNETDTYLDYIGENRIAHEGIATVRALVGEKEQPLDLLDIGSGLGGTLRAAHATGAFRLHGVEPDGEALALSKEIFAGYGITADVRPGVGEALPFESDSVDVITNLTILEHVHDPVRVLQEAMRVLKPNGLLYTFVPNYRFPWEGHYRMVWPPMFPKVIANEYLRLRGRDPAFLDHLHYITPHLVLRTLQRARATRVADLSGARMARKLERPETLTTASSRKLVSRLLALPGLGAFLRGLPHRLERWGLAYPIVVAAWK